jgi:hypothetical protein
MTEAFLALSRGACSDSGDGASTTPPGAPTFRSNTAVNGAMGILFGGSVTTTFSEAKAAKGASARTREYEELIRYLCGERSGHRQSARHGAVELDQEGALG